MQRYYLAEPPKTMEQDLGIMLLQAMLVEETTGQYASVDRRLNYGFKSLICANVSIPIVYEGV
jgi:hypothetical protein